MFLKKYLQQILKNQFYACTLVLVFALLPYTLWASLTIVALVTLRKGTYPGLMATLCGMLAYLLPSYLGLQYMMASEWTVLSFLFCYFLAYLLKISENWRVVLPCILSLILLALIGFQYYMPAYVEANFQAFLRAVKPDSGLLELLNSQVVRDFIPAYLLGVEGVVLTISALFPVIIARYFQALLFYPEGFRREILAFRAQRIALLLIVTCFVLIRYGNLVASTALPLVAFYIVMSGFSFVFGLLRKLDDRFVLTILLIPALLVPYIAFPVLFILGCFDSLVRVRSPLKAP